MWSTPLIALSVLSLSSLPQGRTDQVDFCSILGLQQSNTGNGKCYKILEEKLDYFAAKRACSALGEGVDLASFCDEKDVAAIASLAKGKIK